MMTKAGSRQSRADVSDGSEGFVVSKPCRRIGRERRLCRVKAVQTMTMAGSRQSRADDDYGWVAPKPCGRWLWLSRAKAVHERADRPGGRG